MCWKNCTGIPFDKGIDPFLNLSKPSVEMYVLSVMVRKSLFIIDSKIHASAGCVYNVGKSKFPSE